MTETSSLLPNTGFLKTFSSSNSYPVTTAAASVSPLPNGTIPDLSAQDEEEYTIKCICIYTDDDGNTVYCPNCDTWQHIECYYHGKKVPDEHFCSDCRPRDLDRRKATERQRRAREQLEGGDRKVKRPSSKSSKKKHKDSTSNEQTNGWSNHDRHDSVSNGKDQPPPAKKPKTNHRTSGSIVSVNGESRKRAYSNVQSYPSPSKSPQEVYRFPTISQYTTDFLDLYERDEGTTNCYDNEYTITASNFLSSWKTDRSLIVNHPEQQPNANTPFVYTSEELDKKTWPTTKLCSSTWDAVIDGKHPTWRYLVLESDVQKDEIMGEIRGEVGMLEEYCQQQSNQNRWAELAHPDPFVFFHPHMNIYIDSRKKGTMYRYLRRSCQPNVTLKTFVTDDGEMRHCFVANQDIQSGSELTAAWWLDSRLFNMNTNREDSEHLENQRCEWVSRVLANFGDCACDKTQCPWPRLDRRAPIRSLENSTKTGAGRKKKGKSKQAVSPLSTGQATNSRAGSEAVKGPDDDDQYDRRSTSESSRSGGRSRDATPVNVAVLDAPPVLGDGLTARELRKIQAVEKAFERKEGANDKKKKKRTSGGSMLNTPNVGTSKQIGQSPGPADITQFSGSPPPPRALKDTINKITAAARAAQPVRPVYVSVSTQTEPEDCEVPIPLPKRRKFSTPTQRLLRRVLRDRMLYEQQNGKSPFALSPTALSLNTNPQMDVEMTDAGSAASPSAASSSLSPTSVRESAAVISPTLPYPSQAAHTQTNFKMSPGNKLHLHTLPPVPVFPNGSANGLPTLNTPSGHSPNTLSAISPSFQTMNACAATPSPAKKKLSLGDYMSRRNMSTPVTEKSQAQANAGMADGNVDVESERHLSNASSYTQEDGHYPGSGLEGAAGPGSDANADGDAPIKDEDEAEYSPPDASPMPDEVGEEQERAANAANTPSASAGVEPDVSNVLSQLARYSGGARLQSAGSA